MVVRGLVVVKRGLITLSEDCPEGLRINGEDVR